MSWKTVSNVIHDRPNVGEQTRERVRAAIRQLDYRPSLAGRQLRQGRTMTLMLIIPKLRNAYFAEMLDAVHSAAAARGYAVFVEPVGGAETTTDEIYATSALSKVAYDGLLINPLRLSQEDLTRLAEHKPVVLLGESGARGGPLDRVEIDNVLAAAQIAEHLAATGRTRIGCLGDLEGRTETMRQRIRGYRLGLEAAGLEPPARGIGYVDEYDLATGRRGADALLDAEPRLDAIMCLTDMLAFGALRALQERGIRVPEDIAVSGWDNVAMSNYVTPPLTTIDPRVSAMADRAVSLLVGRIEGTYTEEPRGHVLPHGLIVRQSSQPNGPG